MDEEGFLHGRALAYQNALRRVKLSRSLSDATGSNLVLLAVPYPSASAWRPRKCWAKLANRQAKKRGGVCVLNHESHAGRDLLEDWPVQGLWGVAGRLAARPGKLGIVTAGQLARTKRPLLRQQFGVVIERMPKVLSSSVCPAGTSRKTFGATGKKVELRDMALTRDQQVEILRQFTRTTLGLRLVDLTHLELHPVTKNGITMMAAPNIQSTWRDDVLDHVDELKRKRYIQAWDEHNLDRFKLTERGKRYAKDFIAGSTVEVPDIDDLIRDSELIAKVLPAYRAGNYEDAVFKALKALEERLRTRAQASPNDLGANLVTLALHHTNGKLRIPSCAVTSEEDGAFMLFRGAIQLFKNPSSHRTVDWSDPVATAQVLGLADLLLAMLGTAVPR